MPKKIAREQADLGILRNTLDWYRKNIRITPGFETVIRDDFKDIQTVLTAQDVPEVTRLLMELFNVTSEEGMIKAAVKYPGPGEPFKRLVTRLEKAGQI